MTAAQRDAIVTAARHYVETIGVWVRAEKELRACHVADGYEPWCAASEIVSDAKAMHAAAELALIRAVRAVTQ